MAITRHQYRIYIKATPEQVWQGLVDPAFTRAYFHGTAFDSAPQAGVSYRTTMADGRPAVDGTIEVCDPPHRLVQTWHVLYDAAMEKEPVSRVEWLLTPAGDGLTRLDVTHGDLAQSPLTWAQVKDGWVWILDGLKTLLETGEPLPAETRDVPVVSDDAQGDWHRAQGIECNNTTWEMIEAERTPVNDEEMLRRAYAATYHWARAKGRTAANDARGQWLLAKVHLLCGLAERSLHYADACMTLCHDHGLVDFDLAYAHEARARALRALGQEAEAMEQWAAAKAVPIAQDEDRAILEGDLAIGP
ncbi:MAG: SRPBCC family protein [Actinobacteria bacterium]|nr:SRPBCC family protein [Actinomycetota bacterium]